MDKGNHLNRVPFILVTGFLGSGKTSLLIEILRKYSVKYRIAIVQNEFAPGHVDGATLSNSGESFSLLEINNGSVFCACLLGDFINRLAPFLDQYSPDLVLLEATGLADPISLGQVLQSPELSERIYLAGSWCLVDALNFDRIIRSVSRARHQVRIADLVWINKTDLVGSTDEVRAKILEINPFARIIETSYGTIQGLDLNSYLTGTITTALPEPGTPLNSISSVQIKQENLSSSAEVAVPYTPEFNPPQLKSCVVRSSRFFKEQEVRYFVTEQSQQLFRMKGYIRIDENRTMAIQTVFTDQSIAIITGYEGPSELIAIGPDLLNREFSKQLLSLQNP